MSQMTANPVQESQRIRALDFLRGIALLGILLMNIAYFSTPFMMAQNISVRQEYSGANYYTWWIIEGGFEGTMRALFSMLFGASCLLLLDRLQRNRNADPAKIYYRRLLWLVLFGMFHGYILLWPGDILFTYAICGLFLYPFKDMNAKRLFGMAMLFLIITTAKGTLEMWQEKQKRVNGEKVLALEKSGAGLTAEQEKTKTDWTGYLEQTKRENTLKKAAGMTSVMQSDYAGIFSMTSRWTAKFEGTKLYQVLFLDNIILIFLGMALFRWGVLNGKRSRKFYWLLLITGYGLGIPLSYYEHATLIKTEFDKTLLFDRFFVSFYEFRRIFLVMGHMSVALLLYRYGVLKFLFNWLARVGQMAFSNYLMQTIICVTIFYGIGFGMFGKLQRYEIYFVVLAVWIFQILFSNIWLLYFRFGPLEWLWRSLTYWKRQPMKRGPEGETEEVVTPAIA